MYLSGVSGEGALEGNETVWLQPMRRTDFKAGFCALRYHSNTPTAFYRDVRGSSCLSNQFRRHVSLLLAQVIAGVVEQLRGTRPQGPALEWERQTASFLSLGVTPYLLGPRCPCRRV